MGKAKGWNPSRALVMFLLIIYSILIIYPLIWMLLSGFKDNQGLFLDTWGLPKTWRWENYVMAWKQWI